MKLYGTIRDLHTGEHYTPEALTARVEARSRTIAPHISPDHRNVVLARKASVGFFVDLISIWRAGGCAVCISPELTPPERANVNGLIDPTLIIENDDEIPSPPKGARPEVPPGAQLDAPMLILFTSGTSGQPKGVVHSQRGLLARTALNSAHMGRASLSRTLCLLPTHFGHGLIGNALTAILSGGTLLLMPELGIAGLAQLGPIIDANRVTFLSSVPGVWRLALRLSHSPRGRSLHRVHVGSAPLNVDLWQDIARWSGAPVWNMYGMTETANWASGTNQPGTGAVGHPWGGRIVVAGPDGLPGAPGAGEGELWVKSPSTMTEYFDRPDLTAKALHNGWYRTGDLGHVTEDGSVTLTGRLSDVINVNGLKVHPEELDELYARHPQVQEACAFPIPDDIAGERLGLAVVAEQGLTPDELATWARARLRASATPSRIVMVDEIPRTDRGKLRRASLAARLSPT